MKILFFPVLIAFGALLMFGTLDLPNQGDMSAAPYRERSIVNSAVSAQYYVKHAYEDTHTPNMVTAILADYRSFDTLGEEVVIAVAGLICFLLLRKPKLDV
jgi:multicomponent Na+:H+ antiporter subunit B